MKSPLRIVLLLGGVALVIAGRANEQTSLVIAGFAVIVVGLVFRLIEGRR